MFRNLKRTWRWLAIAVTIGLVCCSQGLAKPPGGGTSYTIVKLDDEHENRTWECYAWDVNNLGEVVGQVEDPETPEVRAAYWEVSGSGGAVQSQLSTLTGGIRAHGINDVGEIVGYGQDSAGQDLAVYWASAGALPLPLPPLTGDSGSCAYAINNQGVVCGLSGGAGGWQAVAWRINWTGGEPSVCGPIALPTPDGSLSSVSAINNNDEDGCAQAVGHFSEPPHVADPTAAVAWTVQSLSNGSLTVVDTRIVEEGLAKALGANDGGTICGEVGWPLEAVVWTDVESLTLHCIKDAPVSTAQDVNNHGVIVGWGGLGLFSHKAVVWPNADARMVLLNKFLGRKSPFLSLVKASAVNDLGEIVGYGFTEVGGSGDAAFLAIPE